MDEARTVIRRLERIEALQSEQAPAGALLTEVRRLLREGEAWLAAERSEAWSRPAREGAGPAVGETGCNGEATAEAAAALAGCRERLGDPREVTAQTAESASL
ncbi:MAG: hypothetical protein ACRDNR_05250 [Gaiellaceae bacterium]